MKYYILFQYGPHHARVDPEGPWDNLEDALEWSTAECGVPHIIASFPGRPAGKFFVADFVFTYNPSSSLLGFAPNGIAFATEASARKARSGTQWILDMRAQR